MGAAEVRAGASPVRAADLACSSAGDAATTAARDLTRGAHVVRAARLPLAAAAAATSIEQLPVKTGHVWPPTIQVLFTQQPPLAHVVAAQHTSPGPPQAVHTSLRQTVLALQAVPVVQQAWPAPPQLECELQASQSNAAQNTAARKPSRVMVNLVRLARAAANFSAQCGYSSSRRSRQTRSADASSPVPRIISIPHPKRGSAKGNTSSRNLRPGVNRTHQDSARGKSETRARPEGVEPLTFGFEAGRTPEGTSRFRGENWPVV